MAQVKQIPSNRRINDIEALRATAILFVVFSHLPALIIWPNSKLDYLHNYFAFWSGVDIFYAISGFVIARELIPRLAALPERSSEQVWRTILAFWIKRAWRILPAAWTWLGVTLACSLVLNRSGAWGLFITNFTGTIAALTQTANIRLWVCHSLTSGCGSNSIYWSLSMEEQFYILLPIACIVLRKRLAYALALVALVQFFIPRAPVSFAWVVRSDALALGVLLAVFSKSKLYNLFEPTFLRSRWAFIVPAILIVSIAALPIETPKLAFIPFSTGVIALASAALVFIASYNRDYVTRCAFIRWPLVMIGTRSFALYLVHMPAYALTREIWFRATPSGTTFDGTYTFRFIATAVFLMIILTEATYRLVEMPMRKRGRDIAERFRADGDAGISRHQIAGD